jgi:CDP-diacylglycerol pyrophosphatase
MPVCDERRRTWRSEDLTGLRGAFLIAIMAMILGLPSPASIRENPDALWRVVHDLCVTDRMLTGLSAPCLAVDRKRGFAVVPDPNTRSQVLLVPTARVAGIESEALLTPGSPNYWAYAWEARVYVARRARRPMPRDTVGMAVNSVFGRTQRQLHIHVDCVRRSVRDALAAHQAIITHAWSLFPYIVVNHRYEVMRLDGEDLGSRDPFKLLANSDPAARADMGAQTLVVVGATFDGAPGFVVLAGHGGRTENPEGAGEDLLDHGCAVLRAP